MDGRERHESIIISTEHKNAIICAVVILLVGAMVKGIIFGYLLGKRRCC